MDWGWGSVSHQESDRYLRAGLDLSTLQHLPPPSALLLLFHSVLLLLCHLRKALAMVEFMESSRLTSLEGREYATLYLRNMTGAQLRLRITKSASSFSSYLFFCLISLPACLWNNPHVNMAFQKSPSQKEYVCLVDPWPRVTYFTLVKVYHKVSWGILEVRLALSDTCSKME